MTGAESDRAGVDWRATLVMDSEEDDGRLSLSARLNSLLTSIPQPRLQATNLFSSEPPSRRSGEIQQQHETMRSTRTRPPSPRITTSISATHPYTNRTMMNRSTKSFSISSKPESSNASHKRDKSQPTFPVLRWFSGKQAVSDQDRTPTQSRPSTPLQYSDSPIDSPASCVSALADALHDDPRLIDAHSPKVELPSRPEAAKLASVLRPWKPPSHLSDLSRAALPTASLSPTTSVYKATYTDPFEDPFAQREHPADLDIFFSPTPEPVAIPHTPAPAHLNRSPPSLSPTSSRTSVETLRSIHERGRGIHTTPPSQRLSLPNLPNPFGWFGVEEDSQHKENLDPLENDGSKTRLSPPQKKQIQQNCEYYPKTRS